ncbi:nucleotide-binding protein, partial [Mycolicibacterium pyrenivorans]
LIRDEGPKGVKAQIQGDEIRVSSKKRDDLQAVIALLKGADLDVALQFVNYR